VNARKETRADLLFAVESLDKQLFLLRFPIASILETVIEFASSTTKSRVSFIIEVKSTLIEELFGRHQNLFSFSGSCMLRHFPESPSVYREDEANT